MTKPIVKLQPTLEVAHILRQHGAEFCAHQPVTPQQSLVIHHLTRCRTAVLGGHVDRCNQCNFVRISYNSCRDRHCPKCQAMARAEWLEARLERILPVPYFHVVFTLPAQLNPVCRHNQRLLYALLFRCASETLLEIAADAKHLGAQIGFTAILHTWGQTLQFHPHLHCVVTGGGLAPDGHSWVAADPTFFLPVKVLGRLFRGKFLAGLSRLRAKGELSFLGTATALAEDSAWHRWLAQLYRQNWVVYAKPPFGGPEQVFRYLGRYSHRVAISNARLIAMNGRAISFWYKDYTDGHQSKCKTLQADEFIRRFLLHVLPPGFVRIRHFGITAGRNLHTKHAVCKQLLTKAQPAPITAPAPAAVVNAPESAESAPPRPPWAERVLQWTGQDPLCCPHCKTRLSRSELLGPCSTLKDRGIALRVAAAPRDTS